MKKVFIAFYSIVILVLILGSIYLFRPYQPTVEYTLNISDSGGMDFNQLEQYKRDLHESYQDAINSVDQKVNMLMVVIGIAITIWVSLNIYNVIQREDIKDIKTFYEKFRETKSDIEKELKKADMNLIKLKMKLAIN